MVSRPEICLGPLLIGYTFLEHIGGVNLIILGIVLLILGALFDIGILFTLGWILILIALVLYVVAAIAGARTGRSLFGRRKHLF